MDTENQIYHLCVSSRFRRSFEDVRVLRGADIWPDHNLLLAKLKWRLKYYGYRDLSKLPKYQVNRPRTEGKKTEFSLELKNIFQALKDLLEDNVDAH